MLGHRTGTASGPRWLTNTGTDTVSAAVTASSPIATTPSADGLSLTRFNDIKLCLYSNKASGSGGNTDREPAVYTVQCFNGSSWVDVPNQVAAPSTPAPNLNEVTFKPIVASQIRVLMTRATGFAVGLKELQVFDSHR